MAFVPNYTATLRATRKIIGTNIRRIREGLGLDLPEFARMADINIHYLDHFERGKNKVHLEALVRISARFEVAMTEFFRDGEME